jgi:hypothetical protein
VPGLFLGHEIQFPDVIKQINIRLDRREEYLRQGGNQDSEVPLWEVWNPKYYWYRNAVDGDSSTTSVSDTDVILISSAMIS